ASSHSNARSHQLQPPTVGWGGGILVLLLLTAILGSLLLRRQATMPFPASGRQAENKSAVIAPSPMSSDIVPASLETPAVSLLPAPELAALPTVDLILGQKEPNDPDLAQWLAHELDRLIAATENPADFSTAFDGLRLV